jgi:hypothetical protein
MLPSHKHILQIFNQIFTNKISLKNLLNERDLLFFGEKLFYLYQEKQYVLNNFLSGCNTLNAVQNKFNRDNNLEALNNAIRDLIFTWLLKKNLSLNNPLKVWYIRNINQAIPAFKNYNLTRLQFQKIFIIIDKVCHDAFMPDLEHNLPEYGEILAKKLKLILFRNYNLKLKKFWQQYNQDLTKFFLKRQQEIISQANKVSFLYIKHHINSLLGKIQILSYKSYRAFDAISDAHMALQFAGVAAQNEALILNIFDLYNCTRAACQLNKFKRIFLPVYEIISYEYWLAHILRSHPYKRILRFILPLAIFCSILIIKLYFLALFGVPDIALIIATIPFSFTSLCITALALKLKNLIYEYFINAMYPNVIDKPFFEINQQMLDAFGTDVAHDIRILYVEQLEIYKKDKEVSLELLTEWFDIRDNEMLPKEGKLAILNARYKKILQSLLVRFALLQPESISKQVVYNTKANLNFFNPKKNAALDFLSTEKKITSILKKSM